MAEVRIYKPEVRPRTGSDFAVLLLEMNRLLGAILKYGPGHAARRDLLQRTFLLWQLEIEHSGPIDLRRNGQEYCHEEFGQIESKDLGELTSAMEVHQLDSILVTRDFDQEVFTRFAILLAVPTAHLDQMCEGGFAGRLYSSSGPGVEVNGLSREPAEPEPPASVAPTLAPEPEKTPPAQSAFPTLEQDPLEAPSMAMTGDRLRLSLRELDRCEEDVLYDALLDKIHSYTRELWDSGQREETYRAMLVLTEHATGGEYGDRSRRAMAQSALEALAETPQLEFLVARACDCEEGGVRPNQILLQLGERSTPVLIDALDRETDRERSTRLSAMVLALGDCAVPALIGAITTRTEGRLQLVVRLAGRLQSPKMVPILANVFHDSGPALRKEAGMALVYIGNLEACDALMRGLARDHEELSSVAALCLGVLRDDHATEALLAALKRARGQRRYGLALEIVRSLGQLSSPQESINRALASILESSEPEDFGNDAAERELKCLALEVLDLSDASESQILILLASQDDDPAVSRKAHEILNERDRAQTS